MFLRASSNAVDAPADEAAIMTAEGDGNVPHGAELIAFTEAVHRLDGSLPEARDALTQAVGEAGMVDAAIIAAVFRGLNIAADTSGIRVDDDWESTAIDLIDSIGTGEFRTVENSPAVAPNESGH